MSKSVVLEFAVPAPTQNRPDAQEHYRVVIEPHDPITVCNIYSQHDPIMDEWWTLCAYGISHRRPGDVYDRETGMRLALTSACRKLKHSDAKVRPQIWQLYLEKFPVSSRTEPEKLRRSQLVHELSRAFGNSIERALTRGFFNIPSVLR